MSGGFLPWTAWVLAGLLGAGGLWAEEEDAVVEGEKPTNEWCMECHGMDDLVKETEDGGEKSLFVDEEAFKASVHGGTTCIECHGDLTMEHPDNEVKARPVACADCHKKEVETFLRSVHGKALRAGDESAPGCADCHGTHDVKSTRSAESPMHFSRQAETCGECHVQEAEDVTASIHGKATAKGIFEAPSCTDCHDGHCIDSMAGSTSLRKVGDTCSRCHESERINTRFGLPSDRVKSFSESYHGLAVKGGAANAANCASCHGYHKVLPSSDPESTIHKANLVETCGKCHPGAGENFAYGSIHTVDSLHGDFGAAVNHWVRIAYLALIVAVVGAMLAHNMMSWVKALRLSREARGETVLRMDAHQRIQHFLLVGSFVLLALSGFALKYPESWLSWMFGANEDIRRWIHRVAGVVMILGGLWHLGYILFTRKGRRLVIDFLPRVQDVKDLWTNLLYFLGRRPAQPRFARFGYVEKMEYWAVVWGTVLMGVTGFMIWFKIDVTQFFPRWVVDVAHTIHFYEAILVCLAIVVWHFYHVLFAPGTYPMNFAWLDGRVSRQWMEHEHPEDECLRRTSESSPPRDPPAAS